ncbi:MAG: glycine zipper 2TM domain-containing protein [Asticcacaulis sp.]|uniref:glycine zipper 2TM domain-containing protein n=1 Tax=Asticcacaulis sp. TaxID=1872648 RepID=UPI0039E22586
MKSLITKTCLIAGAAVMLAQPVLAQETTQATTQATSQVESTTAPTLRPYSQVELREAYERDRADQARDSGRPPEGREPAGYCYQRQANARTTGTIVGAVLGGMVGNSLSNRWDRGSNTVGGALVGGVIGNAVGQGSVECYQNAYYAYDDGYYAPPRPPRGYVTVFFDSTPGYGYGYRHFHDRPYFDRHW